LQNSAIWWQFTRRATQSLRYLSGFSSKCFRETTVCGTLRPSSTLSM